MHLIEQPQSIYCDESGFTGENLLDNNSPFFSYATLAISEGEARDFIQEAFKKDTKLQGEFKFKNLKKTDHGRKLITKTLEIFKGQAKITVYDKKYNLACKFYQYFFDPILGNNLALLYETNFNSFIANILYVEFTESRSYANDLLRAFSQHLREDGNINALQRILADEERAKPRLYITEGIREFCHKNLECLNLDSDQSANISGEKQPLDLTYPSLCSLIFEWGKHFKILDVLYDQSKPLTAQMSNLDRMVDIEQQSFTLFRGKLHASNCRLSKRPQAVNSRDHYGVQVADIFAGASALMSRQSLPTEFASFAPIWREHLAPCLTNPVVASPIYLNSQSIEYRRGQKVLEVLVSRAQNNRFIDEALDAFIAEID